MNFNLFFSEDTDGNHSFLTLAAILIVDLFCLQTFLDQPSLHMLANPADFSPTAINNLQTISCISLNEVGQVHMQFPCTT